MSESIQELKAELEQARSLIDLLLNHNPDGVMIVEGSTGNVMMNPAGAEMVHPGEAAPTNIMEMAAGADVFEADGVTPQPPERNPAVRTLAGDPVKDEVYLLRAKTGKETYVQCNSVKVGDRAIMMFRDVTEKKKLEDQLSQRVEENQELVARLRVALDELSTPVLELWDDVLALPVVGIVDTQRSVQMAERLLKEVMDRRAKYVIIDLTGVDIVDTSTADRLFKLSRAVSLLGSECVMTGIQPNVAQTLIDLGVEFGNMKTQRNLKRALDVYLARSARSSGGVRA